MPNSIPQAGTGSAIRASMESADRDCDQEATKREKAVQMGDLQAESPQSSDHLCILPLFNSSLVVVCLCSEPFVGLHSTSLGVLPSLSEFPLLSPALACMAPRQRLLSRRGTERGRPSRPPKNQPVSHCCPCCCHRPTPSSTLQPSSFLDASSPSHNSGSLPAFGNAIFSFQSSREKPCITAHVSVLFLEDEAKDNDGKGKQKEDSEDLEKKRAKQGRCRRSWYPAKWGGFLLKNGLGLGMRASGMGGDH